MGFLDRLLGQPLQLGQFLRIAMALAAALARLHARGLIHKDLKPSNILVDAKTGAVWLLGFLVRSAEGAGGGRARWYRW